MSVGDRYRDYDGDVWTEDGTGAVELTESADELVLGSWIPSVEELAGRHGPLERLTTVSSPLDKLTAPATRGDVVRLLEVLAALNSGNLDYAANLANRMADEIKAGKA